MAFVVGSVRAIVTHFGVCGDLCNDVMQSLGFVQQLLPLWAFIALFRYSQGLPFLLEALLTLASVNWQNKSIQKRIFFAPVKFQHSDYSSSTPCPICWVTQCHLCSGCAVPPVASVSLARYKTPHKKLRGRRVYLMSPSCSLVYFCRNRAKREQILGREASAFISSLIPLRR